MSFFSWFEKKSFKFKIIFTYIVGLLFIGSIGYGYFFYSQISYFQQEMQKIRKNIYQQNKEMVKTAVNVAENTINIAQYLSTKGVVSEEKAKKIAIYELNSIKYGQSGYVWCMTNDGILIVDPPREDLVGVNVLNVQDKNGFKLFKHVIEILKIKDSAFLRYYWQYPGISDKEFEKLTYVKKVNTWNWIVGSGVYIKDIENQINEYRLKKMNELKKSMIISIIPGLTSSLIVLLLLYIMLSKIMYSVEKVAEISDRLARGDVDINMKLPKMASDGSISKLIENTNKYIENTYNFIKFKEKTDVCSNETEILEHIKNFLKKELNIDSFAIYTKEYNDYIKYHSEGKVECLNIEKCLKMSSKNIYEECKDKKRKFICIPIVSNEEILAMVQIVFDKNSSVESLVNIIKNYIQSTASSIQIRRLNKQLKNLSLRDQLTGLYNRRFLTEFFSTYESTIKRHNITTAVAMADLDNFKKINDTYGHQAGDEVLKNVSTIAKAVFKRKSDLIIRYGGEEILIIAQDINYGNAFNIFEEFRASVESLDTVFGKDTINITISVGWCIIPEDTKELQEAITFSDLALYEAKSLGKNRVIKFDKSILNETFEIKEEKKT